MAEIVGCKDITTILIEQFSNKINQGYKINKEYYNALLEYCDEFDRLVEEFDADGVDVNINEQTMEIQIIIRSPDYMIYSPHNMVFQLIERSKSFELYSNDGSSVCAEFTFPSIWEKQK